MVDLREEDDPVYGGPSAAPAQSLGQPTPATPSLVWQSIAPSGDSYEAKSGSRYAVLASVSKNYALSDVVHYLNGHGWTITYAWEQGQPSRGVYAIDDWLQSLAPDTTDNHRWIFAEGNRTGADASLGDKAPWPLTIYAIADVFEAVPAPAFPPPSAPQAAVAGSSPAPAIAYVAGGVALGALGWWGISLARRVLF